METINFGKKTWLIVLLVVVMIIAIALALSKNTKQENPEEGKLASLLKRWRELSYQLEEEMRTLKLTQEMKLLVEKKVNQLINCAKAIFALAFTIVFAGFYWNSHEILSSLANTSFLFLFIPVAGTFLVATKFAEPNSIIKFVQARIRVWVYKKYGFDPSEEKLLQLTIDEKKSQASLVLVEIRQLNTK
jgi:hypothetical protein